MNFKYYAAYLEQLFKRTTSELVNKYPSIKKKLSSKSISKDKEHKYHNATFGAFIAQGNKISYFTHRVGNF